MNNTSEVTEILKFFSDKGVLDFSLGVEYCTYKGSGFKYRISYSESYLHVSMNYIVDGPLILIKKIPCDMKLFRQTITNIKQRIDHDNYLRNEKAFSDLMNLIRQ